MLPEDKNQVELHVVHRINAHLGIERSRVIIWHQPKRCRENPSYLPYIIPLKRGIWCFFCIILPYLPYSTTRHMRPSGRSQIAWHPESRGWEFHQLNVFDKVSQFRFLYHLCMSLLYHMLYHIIISRQIWLPCLQHYCHMLQIFTSHIQQVVVHIHSHTNPASSSPHLHLLSLDLYQVTCISHQPCRSMFDATWHQGQSVSYKCPSRLVPVKIRLGGRWVFHFLRHRRRWFS